MALLYVQCDWSEALNDEECGKAWMTFKQRGLKGTRTILKQMPNSENQDEPFVTSTSSDFSVGSMGRSSFNVKVKNCMFKVVAPIQTFNTIHGKSITSFDVSSGGLAVSSGDDGIFIWETENGLVRRQLDAGGHVGDVYSVRLFPSGIVVLSCGADMRIKIWSAEDGSCPVTLTGHTAAVTSTAFVDRGRNIVSVSKDSHIRLWNCGQAKCIEPKIEVSDCINCLDITETNLNILEEAMDEDESEEVGTHGKVLVVGGENGTLALIDLRGRKILSSLKLSSAVNRVKFLQDQDHCIVAGCQEGNIYIVQFPEMKIMRQIHDTDSSVCSLLALPNGFISGHYDGACIFYSSPMDMEAEAVRIVLTGADVDPITDMSKDSNFVYTSCRDGCIRKYRISEF